MFLCSPSSFSLFSSASPTCAFVLQVCGRSGTFREVCWKQRFFFFRNSVMYLYIYFTKRNALHFPPRITTLARWGSLCVSMTPRAMSVGG